MNWHLQICHALCRKPNEFQRTELCVPAPGVAREVETEARSQKASKWMLPHSEIDARKQLTTSRHGYIAMFCCSTMAVSLMILGWPFTWPGEPKSDDETSRRAGFLCGTDSEQGRAAGQPGTGPEPSADQPDTPEKSGGQSNSMGHRVLWRVLWRGYT